MFFPLRISIAALILAFGFLTENHSLAAEFVFRGEPIKEVTRIVDSIKTIALNLPKTVNEQNIDIHQVLKTQNIQSLEQIETDLQYLNLRLLNETALPLKMKEAKPQFELIKELFPAIAAYFRSQFTPKETKIFLNLVSYFHGEFKAFNSIEEPSFFLKSSSYYLIAVAMLIAWGKALPVMGEFADMVLPVPTPELRATAAILQNAFFAAVIYGSIYKGHNQFKHRDLTQKRDDYLKIDDTNKSEVTPIDRLCNFILSSPIQSQSRTQH